MDIVSMFRQILLFIATYFTAATTIVLLTGRVGIVHNRNILIDGQYKKKYLEKKYNTLQQTIVDLFTLATWFCYYKCRHLQQILFFPYNICHKPYQNELQDHQNKSFIQIQFLVAIYSNQNWISKKTQLFIFWFVRFIRLANTFHRYSFWDDGPW